MIDLKYSGPVKILGFCFTPMCEDGPDGEGSGWDNASRLRGVEPLGLVQGVRGREAEERKPISHGLTSQALVS
jgi:hypothetical protein